MQYYSKFKVAFLGFLKNRVLYGARDRRHVSSQAHAFSRAGCLKSLFAIILLGYSVHAISESKLPTPISRGEENQAVEATRSTDATLSTETLKATAFNNVVQNVLPLSPKQIAALRKRFNQTKEAEVIRMEVPPKPVISSRPVNLAPGSVPATVRLSQGYISTLAFVDSTGQPWPVENYSIGNPQAFNVQWDKKGNVLMILATELYQDGNLVIQLRNLATPIVLTLLTGQPEVDSRLDLHISGKGPFAKPILGQSEPAHVSPVLMSILDGISPAESTVLKVLGADTVQAWAVKDRIYCRTRLTLLSPAWLAILSSPDGMKAYELPKTPLIMAAINGRPVQLKVQGL